MTVRRSHKWQKRLATWYLSHRLLASFGVMAGVVIAFVVGSSSLAVWCIVVFGGALLVHRLALTALTVDEAWANNRARTLLRNTYDRSNIEGVMRDEKRRRDAHRNS